MRRALRRQDGRWPQSDFFEGQRSAFTARLLHAVPDCDQDHPWDGRRQKKNELPSAAEPAEERPSAAAQSYRRATTANMLNPAWRVSRALRISTGDSSRHLHSSATPRIIVGIDRPLPGVIRTPVACPDYWWPHQRLPDSYPDSPGRSKRSYLFPARDGRATRRTAAQRCSWIASWVGFKSVRMTPAGHLSRRGRKCSVQACEPSSEPWCPLSPMGQGRPRPVLLPLSSQPGFATAEGNSIHHPNESFTAQTTITARSVFVSH